MSDHQENFAFEEISGRTAVQQEQDAIRERYRARLAEKLKDPEFRKIEGFPIGTDEAILALSDPPYYTACPNPFIEEWLSENAKPYQPATDHYHREPFAADVSEGKNDPIYNAHSYHTKVPHKAIMRYILHYTEPGDVVYDGFCGTGMTGVAAQMCGDKAQIESLGYIVDPEGYIWTQDAWARNAEERNTEKQKERNAFKQKTRKPENQKGGEEEGNVIDFGKSGGEDDNSTLDSDLDSDLNSSGFLAFWLSAGMHFSPSASKALPFSKLGARKAILNDLSPAATFIAHNYNTPVDAADFEREAKRVLKEVEDACGWMYTTLHDASSEEIERIADAVNRCQTAEEIRGVYKELQSTQSPLRDLNSRLQIGRINYTVWSDVFICPNCGAEIVFWDVAFDASTGKVADVFACSVCRAETTKRQCQRASVVIYDASIQRNISIAKQVPVFVSYSVRNTRYSSILRPQDRNIIATIDRLPLSNWSPTNPLPIDKMYHGSRLAPKGITHLHHLFKKRTRWVLASFWKETTLPNQQIKQLLRFWIDSQFVNLSIQNRYRPTISFPYNPLNGVYYVGSLVSESNPFTAYQNKFHRVQEALASIPKHRTTIIETKSCSQSNIIAESIDYIFTDPPFGENIYYADLNYQVESWHEVLTDSRPEAIIDQVKKKKLKQYQELMTTSFRAYYGALKPGRWMTVEFSNSSDAVWNSIQEALQRVGFIVADIRILDKKTGSFRQVTAGSTVKEDLVISCYKPHRDFEERFRQLEGKQEAVVEFLREHLTMLPVTPLTKVGRLETVAERTRFLLFDRMIAYHLQRGARIPLSATDFYRLLEEQFVERDEMYFLPEQAARYDALKARGIETEQLSIFVRDEKTAVQWVRGRLSEMAQTLGDLTPRFMQELREWDSHEPRPELRDLLKEYFVETEGVWRVPDPNSEKDIESMRHNALLRLFREYTSAKGPLKVFRKEAVLEGFRHCWETQQYGVIVAVCEKIPEKILQEIQEFVMMYDVAKDLDTSTESQKAFVWE